MGRTAPDSAGLRRTGETRPSLALFPGENISWSAAGRDGALKASLARSASKPRSTSGGLPVAIYTFDVAPARLVKGLITERGVLQADRDMLTSAFPERPRTAEAPE
jgi:translation initiation factor 2B subunit (eIF-2B alpha/beta/delta family)